jgi:hypothetical protein
MKGKRGIEFNFAVLFSIIIGALIIFLAIYASTRAIRTGTSEQQASLTKQLTIIFDPMETGIASGKASSFSFTEESRVYNECFNDNNFGYQRFSFSIKNFNKWGERNTGQRIYNKYVFSSSLEEGKKAYIFSKPFEFPFKVSEVILFTTKNYCFHNSPSFIREEVLSMNIQNIKIKESQNCSSSDTHVCFGTLSYSDCSILVTPSCVNNCDYDYGEYEYGRIKKSEREVYYYSPALLYAGIFSSVDIYECNIKRLMQRASSQATLYAKQSYFINNKCGAVPKEDLLQLSSRALSIQSSSALQTIIPLVKEINELNSETSCELW